MKRFKITKRNRNVINNISEELTPYLVWKPIETNNSIKIFLYNTWAKLVKFRWPNGEYLLKTSTILFINKNIIKQKYMLRSHIGRLIKLYEHEGAGKVAEYLLDFNIPENKVSYFISSFKLSKQNLETVREVEKRLGIKLIK